MAEPRERDRQLRDVSVLPACVDTAEHRQWAGVLRDHCHSQSRHEATSFNIASQSDRKRTRPYLVCAASRATAPHRRAAPASDSSHLAAATSSSTSVESTPAPGGTAITVSVVAST